MIGNTKQPREQTPQMRTLLSRMALCGYSRGQLAKATKMSPGGLRAAFWHGVTNPRLRARIEEVLGAAIWSVPLDYELRCRCRRVFGQDPATLGRADLRALARRLGIGCPREHDLMSALLADVMAALAKDPTITAPKAIKT